MRRRKLLFASLLCLQAAWAAGFGNKETVVMSGWGGDTRVNRWIEEELLPYAERSEGVKAVWAPANIDEILAKSEHEKAAGVPASADLIWINGENFRYAYEHGLLLEGFLAEVPNAQKYLDLSDGKNTTDFGLATGLSEAPWGRAQFVFAADSAKVPVPPESPAALSAWLEANPGRFTYPEPPDFTGSAFLRALIYSLCGGYEAVKDLPAAEADVEAAIKPALDWLLAVKPLLWRRGETYPKTVAALDGLFQDGEVWFTMDYNSQKAYSSVKNGLWPPETRTFVWKSGTPANTHFLAIPAHSRKAEGAKKLINAALSPRMQAAKAALSGWGDSPVLDFSRLSEQEAALFAQNRASLDPKAAAALLDEAALSASAAPELRGDLVVIIEDLWQKRVLLAK